MGERGISLSSPTAEMRDAVYKYASADYGGRGRYEICPSINLRKDE